MKKIITLLLLMVSISISSQTIEKFSVDSGGASYSSNELEILYTIGEVNIQEVNTVTVSISEGFINTLGNSVLRIDETTQTKNSILIYPNPTSEIIYIDSSIKINKVEFYDILGKQVISTNEINEINLNTFSKGIYIIKIFSKCGVETRKVVLK